MNCAACISHAALTEPAVVCGVRLRPFSVGHWILCRRFDLSFIGAAPAHTLGDLLLATLICSRTHAQFMADWQEGRFTREYFAAWQRGLAGGKRGHVVRRLMSRLGIHFTTADALGFDLGDACDQFQSYVDAAGGRGVKANEWAFPFAAPVGEGKESNPAAPEPVRYLCAGIKMGLAHTEAIDMPLPLLRWLVTVEGERNNLLTILDPEEMAKDAAMADKIFAEKIVSEEFAR